MSNNQSINEKDLLTRIAEGDENAFNEFYVNTLPHFTGYVLKLLKSEDAAKEVIQEALIRFWLNRDKLESVENLRAWFFRILSNECYRYLRNYMLQTTNYTEISNTLIKSKSEKDGVRQTEADVSFREIQQEVQNIIVKLSPKQQSIYRMSREQGLTLPEIASDLGVSRDYVKKTLITALRIIRQKLNERGFIFLSFFL
ncbi:RNA polymerase sigma factor [Parafilimonas sp.]|uniref:RNA polymerase sigma factor n=1 Tax=Parafilimonas sp. TaxID=1969739 RepID=UPI0039E68A11